MMAFKDGLGQIIILIVAILTLIPLTMSFSVVEAALIYQRTLTVRTAHPLWPAHLSDLLIAFGIVYQILYRKHLMVSLDKVAHLAYFIPTFLPIFIPLESILSQWLTFL
jgi:hypothetical protein